MSDLIYPVLSLGAIGIASAAILFVVAKKFYVHEDPRIDQVNELLPGANCGACGFAGCRNFAEATVKASELSSLNCPVGGNSCMQAIAKLLGLEVSSQIPKVAVLRCHGSKTNAPAKINYQGAPSCLSAHSMFAGESGCQYGCLGLGDCVKVCSFDALHIDLETGLPVVDPEKCTACGACVKICPRHLFELRPQGPQVYVACMNQEKGGVARKNCSVACIGCMKCTKVYETDQIKITNFLSYIGPDIDVKNHGTELVKCCPTKAIHGVNLGEDTNEA